MKNKILHGRSLKKKIHGPLNVQIPKNTKRHKSIFLNLQNKYISKMIWRKVKMNQFFLSPLGAYRVRIRIIFLEIIHNYYTINFKINELPKIFHILGGKSKYETYNYDITYTKFGVNILC